MTAHFVFVVKYRRRVITDRVRETLLAAMQDTASRLGCEIQAADGEADHIHVLVAYPPSISVSKLALALKANSSRRVRARRFPEVRRKLWGAHFWTGFYFVRSTGGANLATVKTYIENQRAERTPARSAPTRLISPPSRTGFYGAS